MKQIFHSAFLVLYLFCQPLLACAEDNKTTPKEMISAPKFVSLGKANGNDIIKMECDGQAPTFSLLNCDFTEVLIIMKSEGELAKAREERRKAFSQITAKDFNDMRTSLKKIRGELTKERKALLDSLTPEKKTYNNRLALMLENMDKCKSRDELFKVLEEFDEFENKCCTVHINAWKDDFKRISRFKWISNPGPQGLCNVVRIKTLESSDDLYLLWKYTDVAVSVDFDKTKKDFFNQFCAGIELNKPVVYSWDIPTQFVSDCECIKYSW
jgi:hypothetical protein